MRARDRLSAAILVVLLALPGACSTGDVSPAPRAAAAAASVGTASWYGGKFQCRKTASGQIYGQTQAAPAHRTLPFGTRVRVTNLENGRAMVLTINDRGPFKRGRIIDVSRAAAVKLGFLNQGLARVRVEVIQLGKR